MIKNTFIDTKNFSSLRTFFDSEGVANRSNTSRTIGVGRVLCAVGLVSVLSACGGGGNATPSTPTYSIGGTLSGMAQGQTIDLILGSETLRRSTNGTFTFATPVAQGVSYSVSLSGAQPAWQTCSVSSGAGTANTNVNNVAVSCVSADTVATGQLNDTGISWCTANITTPSSWVNGAVCSAINWVGNLWGQQQDAFFGRDAQATAGTLTKVGSGIAGFYFTRIGASGKLLTKQDATYSQTGTEADGTQWDCVRDNVTGLVWEIKRNDATHLRHMGHSYTWYNPDTATNGGGVGAQAGGTCVGVANTAQCNTQSYVQAVNAVGLCGKKDWRLPTVDELHNLANTGRVTPPLSIDTNHFPNTVAIKSWSASPHAWNTNKAFFVNFNFGSDNFAAFKTNAFSLRLVRSGQ